MTSACKYVCLMRHFPNKSTLWRPAQIYKRRKISDLERVQGNTSKEETTRLKVASAPSVPESCLCGWFELVLTFKVVVVSMC